MIVVHHLNNSRSQRVLWLLEELGVPYEIKFYERNPETKLAPPELKKVHPLGKSPVITDGEMTVAESGAILEYLVEKYGEGRLKPKTGTPEALAYRYWMHYAEGSAMTPALLKLIFSKIEQAPLLVRPVAKGISKQVHRLLIDPQMQSHSDFIESELQKHEWFAGAEFTAADIQMSFPVEAYAARSNVATTHPKIANFLKRIHARPAYQRALTKGGPFSLGSF